MADQKISELTALAALPATNDYFVVLDTDASATKKLAANYLYHDWASHTATVTASSGTFTTVAGGHRYFTLHGKTRVLQGLVYITTKGTADGTIYVTIPSGAAAAFMGGNWPVYGRCTTGAISAVLNVTESRIEILEYDATTAVADGMSISYGVIYELA